MEKKVMLGDMGMLHPFQFSPSSSSPPPSRYKGVANHPSSQWATQIYDQAAFKLHSGDHITNFNNMGFREGGGEGDFKAGENVEKEHMFDKVVTPSDVGKLNRLVIPKQHAEKYFPLDSTANEKGLLLNFEDRSGKSWRFRYSYWNSSQSYVMTKGWSRFVKEKKLDAGDIVSFERGVGELAKDRLYIDWKRRTNVAVTVTEAAFQLPRCPWGRSFLMPASTNHTHMSLQQQLNFGRWRCAGGHGHSYNGLSPGPLIYRGQAGPQAVVGGVRNEVLPLGFSSVPVVPGNLVAAKRLRLFGVNLESPSTEDADGNFLSSTVSQTRVASLSPQTPSLPSLQLRLFNGAPLPLGLEELPKKRKSSLSLELNI